MSQFASAGLMLGQISIAAVPLYRGRQHSAEGGLYSRSTLPTDAIGATTVTFDGVVAGIEIRVYNQQHEELAGVESCAENQQLSWPVYAPGSPNNSVQIKIIGFNYKIKDFPYVSKVGDQSIPIQLEPDIWAT